MSDVPEFNKTKMLYNLLKGEKCMLCIYSDEGDVTTSFISEEVSPMEMVWMLDTLNRRVSHAIEAGSEETEV